MTKVPRAEIAAELRRLTRQISDLAGRLVGGGSTQVISKLFDSIGLEFGNCKAAFNQPSEMEEPRVKKPRKADSFREKISSYLPDGVLQLVYSFLPTRVVYLVLIQHRSFRLFLSKVREYAELDSRDAAIEYTWLCNQAKIGECLSEETDILHDFISGEHPFSALFDLRGVAEGYLGSRARILVDIAVDKYIIFDDENLYQLRAVGLVASSR